MDVPELVQRRGGRSCPAICCAPDCIASQKESLFSALMASAIMSLCSSFCFLGRRGKRFFMAYSFKAGHGESLKEKVTLLFERGGIFRGKIKKSSHFLI